MYLQLYLNFLDTPVWSLKRTAVSKAQCSRLLIKSDDKARRKELKRLILLLLSQKSNSFAHLDINNILEKYSHFLFVSDSETVVMAVVGFRLRIQRFMDLTYFCLSWLITNVVVKIWKSWANRNIFLEIILVANFLVLLFSMVREKLKIPSKFTNRVIIMNIHQYGYYPHIYATQQGFLCISVLG